MAAPWSPAWLRNRAPRQSLGARCRIAASAPHLVAILVLLDNVCNVVELEHGLERSVGCAPGVEGVEELNAVLVEERLGVCGRAG
jgi:hypothetical protein